jgi:hypothetical protein
LCELGLDYWIEMELKKLEPDIENKMPQSGGVLVRIVVERWTVPTGNGTRPKDVTDVDIAATGSTLWAAVGDYCSCPHVVQGAPEDSDREERFLWVTCKEVQPSSPFVSSRPSRSGRDGNGKDARPIA